MPPRELRPTQLCVSWKRKNNGRNALGLLNILQNWASDSNLVKNAHRLPEITARKSNWTRKYTLAVGSLALCKMSDSPVICALPWAQRKIRHWTGFWTECTISMRYQGITLNAKSGVHACQLRKLLLNYKNGHQLLSPNRTYNFLDFLGMNSIPPTSRKCVS